MSRVAGVPGDPLTYYAATASGGVWKSEDGGVRWKPIFDDQPVSSIGSIAIAPSDPNVVYVGSGEANIRGNVAQGNGIYKSTDAGKTWQHVWTQDGQIGTLVVHPTNADVAYAAVLGKPFGPNPERGVYRTRDGGKTWDKVLYKDEDTGASDVALDPHNPRIVYAGFWQARRRPWELVSGGPGSGLYVSRTAATRGRRSAARGCPRGSGARSASRSPPRTRGASTRSSRPTRAGSSARTTAARPGRSRAGTTRCGSGPGTTRRSPSTRKPPTSCGSRRCRCSRRWTAAGRSRA